VPHSPSTSSIRSGVQTCFPTTTVMLYLLYFLPPHACQSPVNIYREAQIMLFLMQFSPASCHFELPPSAPCSQLSHPFQQHTKFHSYACFSIIPVQLVTLTGFLKYSQPVWCTKRFRTFRPSPLMFITCQTLVRYVVTLPNIHLCADIKDPLVNGTSERSAMLMTRKGRHQWQHIHTVFHATSQYVSVKTDFCVWIGLQRDRPGFLVMMQEH
jgi:hypothetical protein